MIIKYQVILRKMILLGLFLYSAILHASIAKAADFQFTPGEKLKYALRWENIPAGELQLEIHPITTINDALSYHFVLIAKSNAAVDLFYKVRDRIDAYANTGMTHFEYYQKTQSNGNNARYESAVFDWMNENVLYTDSGAPQKRVKALPGSFDPLSAFYYTRMVISEKNPQIELPVTDGKKIMIGKARITGRETVTLQSGNRYDTLILEPDISLFGGIFKKSKDAQIRVWITADKRRIPVQIKAKVKVGHFVGELVSATGV
jgi:hypothetical protein